MIRSYLFDYSKTYIAVKGRITVPGTNNDNIKKKKLMVKNNAPFTSRVSKINRTS